MNTRFIFNVGCYWSTMSTVENACYAWIAISLKEACHNTQNGSSNADVLFTKDWMETKRCLLTQVHDIF